MTERASKPVDRIAASCIAVRLRLLNRVVTNLYVAALRTWRNPSMRGGSVNTASTAGPTTPAWSRSAGPPSTTSARTSSASSRRPRPSSASSAG